MRVCVCVCTCLVVYMCMCVALVCVDSWTDKGGQQSQKAGRLKPEKTARKRTAERERESVCKAGIEEKR